MNDSEERRSGVRTLLAPNPSPMTLDGTRTFLVGSESPVVIDPGPASSEHLGRIVEQLAGRRPVAIVLTHSHVDHSGAAIALGDATGAPIWMAPGALVSELPPSAVARWTGEGDTLETDAGVLRIMRTPGHAPEHIALEWREGAAPPKGAVFVGDLIMGEGDTTLVAYPEGSVRDYLRSLERLRSIGSDILFPTHGPPIEQVPEAIDRFRRHRLDRVEQVRKVLAAEGRIPVNRLTDVIYGRALDPRLRAAAEATLETIVRYLEEID